MLLLLLMMPCVRGEGRDKYNIICYLALPVPVPWGRGARYNNGSTAKSEMNVSVILTEFDSSSQM